MSSEVDPLLEPCPFCGCVEVGWVGVPARDHRFWIAVTCVACGAQMAGHGDSQTAAMHDAARRWNARHGQPVAFGLAGRVYFLDMRAAFDWWRLMKDPPPVAEPVEPVTGPFTEAEIRTLLRAATGKPLRFDSLRLHLQRAVGKLEGMLKGDARG